MPERTFFDVLRIPLRRETFFLLSLTFSSLLLGMVLARHSEIWLDEANSVLIAQASWPELYARLLVDSSPPLYYALLKLWGSIVGWEPLAIKLPSVLAGALCIPALYALGKRMFNARTGLLASILLLLHPLHLYYSAEVRMYALLLLLALLYVSVLWFSETSTTQQTRRQKRGRELLLFCLGIGLLYLHYNAWPFVAVALTIAAVCRSLPLRRLLAHALTLGLGILPLLPLFLTQAKNPYHIAWIAPFWEDSPGILALVKTARCLLLSSYVPPYIPLQKIPDWIGLSTLCLLLALLVLTLHRKTIKSAANPMISLLAIAFGPLVLVLGYSSLSHPTYIPGRSDYLALPFFIAMLALLISSQPRRTVMIAACLVILPAGAQLGASIPALQKPGNAALSALVTERCQNPIAVGYAYAPLAYYLRLQRHHNGVRGFPAAIEQHPGNFIPQPLSEEGFQREWARFELNEAPDCLIASDTPYGRAVIDLVSRKYRVEWLDRIPLSVSRTPQLVLALRPQSP